MRSRYSGCPTESVFAFENVEARVTVKGESINASVLEIAPRELKLLTSTFCPRWVSVGIRLQSALDGVDALVLGVVHWIQRVEDGWQIGIWLDEEVAECIVSSFWQDMRRELRYEVNWGAVAQFPDGARHAIQITNYSLNGMRFVSSNAIANANEFLLWNSFDPCAAVTCGVTSWSSASASQRYIVGCNLSDEGGFALARAFTEVPLPTNPGANAEDETKLQVARDLLQFTGK
ncbi:MAG: hypothetical protein AB8G99_12970 [Planctomycetaceae bacterium]